MQFAPAFYERISIETMYNTLKLRLKKYLKGKRY